MPRLRQPKRCCTNSSGRGGEPDSLGADRGYCQRGLVHTMRGRGIKLHIAKIEGRTVPGLDGVEIRPLKPFCRVEIEGMAFMVRGG